jgi:predicted metalloprotease with PDZ domain
MRAGYVGRPYSLKDLRDTLGELVHDKAFADEFFDKYVEGHDAADYARLLERAGYAVHPRNPDAGWAGSVELRQDAAGLRVTALVPFDTPAYDAGLDLDDVIATIDGQPATDGAWAAFRQRKPGESVALTIRRRDGKVVAKTLTLKADPAVAIDDLAQTGTLTAEQKAFRESWLGTKIK